MPAIHGAAEKCSCIFGMPAIHGRQKKPGRSRAKSQGETVEELLQSSPIDEPDVARAQIEIAREQRLDLSG
ncbi:MAG TPA: hypothetical protein VKA43_07965, partial [Gammaproteobacteria bacterium]|nr:hypothetical protein [Gammaproteobacteria bacterium]